MKHPLYAVILLPLLVVTIWLLRLATQDPPSGNIITGLSSLLYLEGTYDEETLADHINGAAEAFFAAGFELCNVYGGEFEGVDVVLEEYIMTSVGAAETIIESEGGDVFTAEYFAFTCGDKLFKATLYPPSSSAGEKLQALVKEARCL